MMQNLPNKLPNVGTSIFTEMSNLANKFGAINLAQGFPEFNTPDFLKNAVSEAISENKNQYAPAIGLPDLLQQIALLIQTSYQQNIEPTTQITLTAGATPALFVAIQTLVSSGDEVIVFDPAYDAYKPAINLAGGKSIHIPLKAPDYKIDWDFVKNKITNRTQLILINTPHNPSATLITKQDMKTLEKLVIENNLYLISDEVYEFITFDNKRHESVLRYPELFKRSFIISSFGKSFHCTGWRLGYAVAPPEMMQQFRKIYQYVNFSCFTPAQFGMASMLINHTEHIAQLSGFYQEKRDTLVKALEFSKLKLLPAQGTYFLLADYSNISDLADKEFCYWLTEKIGVTAIPLSPFYQSPTKDKIIRLCFAKNNDTLIESGQRLCQI